MVGPNGAGKSTALRLMAGLLQPEEGHVSVDGRPLAEIGRKELARIVTYVPQDAPSTAAFSVRECVAMGRYCHRGRFQSEGPEDRRAVHDAMATMDCAHLSDRYLGELSGGEIQRVILARSLATAAPYLLLDEPTANLDIEHSLAILDHVRTIAATGRAVLMALHDLNSVVRATDFVYVLNRGTTQRSGPPLEALSERVIREVFSVQAELIQGSVGEAYRFERLKSTDEPTKDLCHGRISLD